VLFFTYTRGLHSLHVLWNYFKIWHLNCSFFNFTNVHLHASTLHNTERSYKESPHSKKPQIYWRKVETREKRNKRKLYSNVISKENLKCTKGTFVQVPDFFCFDYMVATICSSFSVLFYTCYWELLFLILCLWLLVSLNYINNCQTRWNT